MVQLLPSLRSKSGVKSNLQALSNLVLDADLSAQGVVSVPALSESQSCKTCKMLANTDI